MIQQLTEISPYLPQIIAAYAAFTIAVMSPGPNILGIAAVAMGEGRPTAVKLALGVSAGTFTWCTLTVVGVTVVLAAHEGVGPVMRAVGGAYLLWLGYKAFRSASRKGDFDPAAGAPSGLRRRGPAYLRGYLLQVTNPKAILFWVSIMTVFVKPGTPHWVAGAIIAGITCISLSFHTAIAVAFSSRAAVAIYRRARRPIEVVLGAFFLGLGGKLILG